MIFRRKAPKAFRLFLLAVFAWLCAASFVHAQDSNTLIQAARDGDPNAQFELASRYAKGQGLPLDMEQSIFWLEKSAAQDHVLAQMGLALAYSSGTGVPKSMEKALAWWERAADQGQYSAMYNAALMHRQGIGTPKNPQKAVKWLEKAADLGLGAAQNMLGDMYYQGEGVRQSTKKAVKWYEKAAEQKVGPAFASLGAVYLQGDNPDYKQALEWYRKGADMGDAECQKNLGLAYTGRWGVHENLTQAVIWLGKAAKQGHTSAQVLLAKIYFENDMIDLAEEWAKEAAKAQDPKGLYLWARVLIIREDHDRAEQVMQQSAALGYAPAKAWLERIE